ncbi:MAG: wax ester/triacylglycerol synthase family O-acyltransferase [Pseudomonadales bacterium]|nr:wax ester/triacylglycerol synthase family O-acyltransferase [Pseudomonadales bacterium]
MTPLSLTDQLFLLLEKRQQPMQIGALLLFDYPEGYDYDAEYATELFESLRAYNHPTDPYHLRLQWRGGRYYWTEDREFDLEHHVRHSALPKPGRIRELLTHVSTEHSNLLDRERPLWECDFIEGIEGKRFALYMKVHHSVTDGMSAIRSLTRFLTEDENLRGAPPPWAMPDQPRIKRYKRFDNKLQQLDFMVSDLMKKLQIVPHVYKNLRANYQPDAEGLHGLALQAPQSILNKRITGSRRYAAQSYDLERIKAIGEPYGATINDVVLAVCGSALRKYLISQNALPNESLIAAVPVSMREQGTEGGGNQLALLQASLGTHLSDPELRLLSVKKSVLDAKDRIQKMSKEEYLLYLVLTMSPGALHLVTGIRPNWLPCNVLISNVPGPQQQLYWNGAPLQGMYPISMPLDRVALNITLMSYNGRIDFGLTACRRSMPSMQRLIDYIEDGIVELEDLSQNRQPNKNHRYREASVMD